MTDEPTGGTTPTKPDPRDPRSGGDPKGTNNGIWSADLPPATGVDPCSLVDLDWLDFVLATGESDVRGYMIALTYSKFALVLDDLINPGNSVMQQLGIGCGDGYREARKRPTVPVRRLVGTNANWFNFGTWGTITVTGNISNQRLPQRFSEGFVPLRRRLSPLVMRNEQPLGRRSAAALSWGQRLIFISACFGWSSSIEICAPRTEIRLSSSCTRTQESASPCTQTSAS